MRLATCGIFKFLPGHLLVVAVMACLLGQCGCEFIKFASGEGNWVYPDILKNGDANDITNWGLAQVDDDEIRSALGALSEYSGVHYGNRNRVADAEAGIVKIYLKLIDGWPGYAEIGSPDPDTSAPISPARRQELLERQIKWVYDCLLTIPDVPTFLALRPDQKKFPGRYSDWWNEAKRVYHEAIEGYPPPDDQLDSQRERQD